MKLEWKIFRAMGIFLVLITVVYWFLAREPVGTTALFLSFGMAGLIGFYLWFVSRRLEPRPEDRSDALIAEGAGEMGFFSPQSWWPLPIAAGGALVSLGIVFGLWLVAVGLLVAGFGVLGLVFEYYRGEFAH